MSADKLKLVGVKAPMLKNPAKSTIRLDRTTGECVRAVAKHAGFPTPGSLIEAMLVTYCEAKHPELKLEFDRSEEMADES